jgi:NADH ubiquinone oxidoreductase subunit
MGCKSTHPRPLREIAKVGIITELQLLARALGENYASRGAVSSVIPVDVAVPGCPPDPMAIMRGILTAVTTAAKGRQFRSAPAAVRRHCVHRVALAIPACLATLHRGYQRDLDGVFLVPAMDDAVIGDNPFHIAVLWIVARG